MSCLSGSAAIKFTGKWGEFDKTGVNFINILLTAFTREDPKRIKIQTSCQYLFALYGAGRIKAACKMFMKLTAAQVCFSGFTGAMVKFEGKQVLLEANCGIDQSQNI